MFALLLLAMGLIVANAAEAVVGDKGPVGNKGPVGDKGPIGNKGPAGNVGATGLTGLKGPRGGAKGDQGIPGTNGAKGDKGIPGTNGAKGDKGDAGTQIANGTHTGDTLVWNGSAWTPVAAEPVYILGDIRPDGGIVYYLDGSGRHGLAAQPNDETSLMNWTDAMAAAQAHNNPACPTDILRTPNCWHLPSKNELSWLYEQKSVVGGFANNYYWSSTEYNSYTTWGQHFGNGSQSNYNKPSTNVGVRAVLAF